MGLTTLLNTHFNPRENTKQVKDNSFASNALGVSGILLLATAGIGYQFFGAKKQNVALLAGAGLGFLASYQTEKDGYAYLVAAAAACGMTYGVVDAVSSGRLWVTVHFDIAEIIRAVRESSQRK